MGVPEKFNLKCIDVFTGVEDGNTYINTNYITEISKNNYLNCYELTILYNTILLFNVKTKEDLEEFFKFIFN